MAKVTYMHIDEVNPDLEQNYVVGQFSLMESKGKFATYVDGETGFQVIFEGKKLQYTDEAGLVKGTVNQIRFVTGADETFATISDLSIGKVRKLENILISGDDFGGVSGLLSHVLEHDDKILGTTHGDALAGEAGNDLIKGKQGADLIVGNFGNDTLSGGGGNDRFDFFGEAGKDVITDFNIGDEENFDLILIRETGFKMVEDKDGFLKFKFDDGSSVVLEGVLFADRGDVHVDAVL